MPNYVYKASTTDGRVVTGKIEATNEEVLYRTLKERGLFPVDIKVEGVLQKDLNFDFGTKVGLKDLSVFARQFSALINAGVTVLACLDLLRQQTANKKLAKVISDMHDEVQKGTSVSSAMSNHTDVFPPILIHMVEAGEVSGSLEVALERLSLHFEKENKIAGKVKGAMTYPIVVISIAFIAVGAILVLVIPTFKDMFTQMNIELPLLTTMMLALSEFVQNFWYIVALLIAGVIVGFKLYARSPGGQLVISKLALKVPYFGDLNIKVASSRFCRTLSTMLASGLSLLLALDITSKVIGNSYIEKKLGEVKEKVSNGSNISDPLKSLELFPPMVGHMATVGENTGELEKLLQRTAEYYDDEVDLAVSQLTAMMEPAIILVLGGVVLVIVLAVFQPMMSIYQAAGNA